MPTNQYRLISLDRQIGIGVAEAQQVTISAAAKMNTPQAPYCVANELICGELGRFLCLPVPPCGIVCQNNGPAWFASMDFNLTGNSLPPVDPQRCVAVLPDASAGLLLFDILIGNCDRHRRNFAVDYSSKEPRMSIFDHSHALFGYETGKAKERLKLLRDRLSISGGTHTRGNRHCLLDEISSDNNFRQWIDRILKLPDYLIEGLCKDAVNFGVTVDESDEATLFLKYRRENLQTIILNNKTEFRRITQWSLFL